MVATAAPPAPTTLDLNTLADTLDLMEATANGHVLERTTEVRCGINALLSGRHLCMVGPPGVAKSMLTRTLVRLVGDIADGQYFEWFVTKFSTPEELFGPHSLRALEQDRYVRATGHKLPEARVAFIDEIFKASSALLNTLLPVLNERLFYNNGAPMQLDLASVFCASNETPEEASDLAALWDRIAFRLFTKPIQNEGNFEAMLRAATNRVPILPVISWDELMAAKAMVSQVVIPDDVYEAITNLRAALARENILPSERRFVECLPIIQAQAVRNRRMMATIDDMRLLSHVLWNTQAQQPLVQRLVAELANPDDKIVMEIESAVEQLAKELDELLATADNAQARGRKAVEIQGKLEAATDDLKEVRKKMEAAGRTSDLVDPLRQRIYGVSKRLFRECFALPEDMVDTD